MSSRLRAVGILRLWACGVLCLGLATTGCVQKEFQDVKAQMVAGVAEYAAEVRAGAFPAPEHSYSIDEDELRRFERELD